MRLLLAHVGSMERSGRLLGGALLLGNGGLLLALGLSQDPGAARYSFGAVGTLSIVSGGLGILIPSKTETLHVTFARDMAGARDPAAVVAKAEKALFDLARSYRTARKMILVAGCAVVALSAFEFFRVEKEDPLGDVLRLAYGVNAAAGAAAIGISLTPYPIERMADLWQKDPGIQRMPRLTVGPLTGGAMIGLVGEF